MFEQSALLSCFIPAPTFQGSTHTHNFTCVLSYRDIYNSKQTGTHFILSFLLMHAINQPIFYIYLSLMLIHRLDLTIAITGFRMFALLVSTRQPLMTISSIMKCAFSMLNIIYTQLIRSSSSLSVRNARERERRRIVSYIKLTLYESFIINILGFLTTFSKYLSIVSTKL